MHKAVAVLSLMTMFGCGAGVEDEPEVFDTIEAEIAGGSDTSGYAPVGALFWSKTGALCTGFLVAPRIVMTAAHCTDNQGMPTGFYTGAGSKVSGTGGTVKNLTKHTINAESVHSTYDPKGGDSKTIDGILKRYRNDVALYRLSKAIDITPLTLAEKQPSKGSTCTVVGFGRDSEGNNYNIFKKRKATMSIVDFGGTQMQMKRESGETTPGDSGGPLICSGKVYGISSFSIASANAPTNDIDFHQRVWTMGSYVESTAKKWGVSAP